MFPTKSAYLSEILRVASEVTRARPRSSAGGRKPRRVHVEGKAPSGAYPFVLTRTANFVDWLPWDSERVVRDIFLFSFSTLLFAEKHHVACKISRELPTLIGREPHDRGVPEPSRALIGSRHNSSLVTGFYAASGAIARAWYSPRLN